jgi:hypothetical protein
MKMLLRKLLVSLLVPAAIAAIVPYPGEGGPCKNEFGYSNFDYGQHKVQWDAIHEAYCKGLGPLVGYGYETIDAQDRTLFSRYFTDDGEDRSDVSETFKLLLDVFAGQGPNDLLWAIVVDREDFLNLCPLGHAGYNSLDRYSRRLHFCDVAFEHPVLPSDIECEDLHAKPDVEMENLARIVLHELLHDARIAEYGPARTITDTKNKDNFPAYYPQRTHALVEENPGLASA